MNQVIREGVKTKVLMLSATPVNNRFIDLRNQLALAYEGNSTLINEKLNISKPIDEIFRNAQKAFNIWSGFELFGQNVLGIEDFLVSNILLPVGSLIYLLFCVTKFGWGFDNYLTECNTGKGMKFARFLKPYFQFVLPILVLIVLVQGFIK